ncbi:MAG TPA: cation transporter [Rubrobacteraceae bacterium]|nr:cation transporter [Rubrobacteraceae bacterium]
MTSVQFNVTGMSCAHCRAAVEGELNKVDGVERSRADIENNTVEVTYDESRVAPERLTQAIEAAGYDVA